MKAILPNFLIIGAGKSGTTSLNEYLNQHPDIFMSAVKEPNYFAYAGKSADDFSDESTVQHFKNSITEISRYEALFAEAALESAIGEVSNTYLYTESALNNIKNTLPDVRLIVILRQPAQRLFSRYTHLLRDNKMPSNSFEDVFDRKSVWWERPDLVTEGFYAKHLERFYKVFPANKIKVLFFEDLKNSPQDLLNELTDFLKVTRFQFASFTSFNKSGKIKNKAFDKLVGHNSIVFKTFKGALPIFYNKLKQNRYFKERLEGFRSSNIESVKLSQELKTRLTSDIYRDDIKKLEALISTNLSHWYKF